MGFVSRTSGTIMRFILHVSIQRLPSAWLYALIAMNRIIPNPTNIAPSESLAKLVRVIEALCVS